MPQCESSPPLRAFFLRASSDSGCRAPSSSADTLRTTHNLSYSDTLSTYALDTSPPLGAGSVSYSTATAKTGTAVSISAPRFNPRHREQEAVGSNACHYSHELRPWALIAEGGKGKGMGDWSEGYGVLRE